MAEPSLPGMPVVLRVIDVTQDKEIRRFQLNYNSRHARNRITKTQFWALNNGHAVELIREQDDKP